MDTAIEQARAGHGPTVIEMLTYRLADHTTADDARRYRGDEEVENAWRIEPIKRLRRYLKDQGVWNDKNELELLRKAAEKVAVAVEEYLAVGDQNIESMFDYMFENIPAELEEQRARALEELS
jgi:2-oxoisovalerate dehydrogenase E1 component alpha subunit